MLFGWEALETGNFIVGLVVILVVYGLLCFCISKVVRRKSGLIIAIASFILTMLTYIFYSVAGLIIILCYCSNRLIRLYVLSHAHW